MADFPCKNPNCKSFGQSHPNCRCGGPGQNGYAEGGEVEAYCSKGSAHSPDCQYFDEGGKADEPPPSFEATQPISASPQPSGTVNADAPPPSFEATEPVKEDAPPPSFEATEPGANDKYSTPGQQALTAVEGAVRGVAGPVATAGEILASKVNPVDIPLHGPLATLGKIGLSKLQEMDISPEAQAARSEANPSIHAGSEIASTVGSMMTGAGEAGLALKAGEAAAKWAGLGKLGSGILANGLQNALIQGGDEISKGMLSQGDPTHPVAAALVHMAAAGLIGGAAHGVFSSLGAGAEKGFGALEDAKLGTKAENFLRGVGYASDPASKPIYDPFLHEYTKPLENSAFKAGQKAYEGFMSKTPDELAYIASKGVAATASTFLPGGVATYEALQSILKPYMKPLANKAISITDKYIPGAVAKALSMGETTGLFHIIDHAKGIGKAAKKMSDGVESLFKAGGNQVVPEVVSPRDKERINAYVEGGGPNAELDQEKQKEPTPQPGPSAPPPPAYAEGGNVAPDISMPSPEAPPLPQANPIAAVYPEQDMLLQAAKGRMYNYLNNLRPQPQMGAKPFDTQVKDKNKERTYDRALEVAHAPLSILNHIKRGTITPEHVQHLNGIYPEVYNSLSQKLMERASQAQMKGHKLDYKTRVAMSMFLGQPLDSTMTPQAIMAAQSSSMSGKQQPPPAPPKKSTAALSKLPQQYQTASQSLETRHQRQK